MRIAVIGAGGVGGYFGGKLAVAGHEVTLLARGRHLRAIQENGLLVKSIHGDFKAEVLATDQWAEIPPVDLVLVAVKAWQVQEVREHLKSILHESTVVLPLQNGVVAAKELSEVLGEGPVLGGLCRIISKIEAPGVINHFGATPSIILGERQGGTSHRSENIAQSLNEAGIQAIDSPDIRVDLWKKFIFICVGGLETVSRTTNGAMRSQAETRQLMVELLQENLRIAQALGVAVGEEYIDQTIQFIDDLPADSTFSMARDIWEGRPSELDYLNGVIVQLAAEHGIDVPINRFVYHCLLPMERKARRDQS